MNFYPSDDDVQGHERIGDTVYIMVTIILSLFFIPTFCGAQFNNDCWFKVLEHNCFVNTANCTFSAYVEPEPADYKFVDNWFWIKGRKGVEYLYRVDGKECQELYSICDAGDFTQGLHTEPICKVTVIDTIFQCGIGEPYNRVEQRFNCTCDTTIKTNIRPLEEDFITDTIPHPTSGVIVDTLTNQFGCDSIVTIILVATDFEADTEITAAPQDSTNTDDDGQDYNPSNNQGAHDILESGDERLDDEIEPTKVFFPNAISPNGDGVNDCFEGFTNGPPIEKVIIADRWGNLISETLAPPPGACLWNGKFRGFKLTGVFAYAAMINGKVYKGNFTAY